MNLSYFDIFFIFEKAYRVALAAGQEPQLSERVFPKKRIFITYSTVLASGIARRDPPRRGDLDAQILVKKKPYVAPVREKSLIC